MTPKHLSISRSQNLVRNVAVLAVGFALLWPINSATAQDSGSSDDVWAGVEEMVVSGSSAGGILADVARSNSVTAFSSDDLEAIGAADISDIANFTPNLEIVTAGATAPTFFIRGIGLNDFNSNAAGSVAIYTDDVPLNNPALQLGSLFDIEGANVLRGPQGTGPFRNASAGAIKVYSRKPTGDFSTSLKAEFGNYNSRDLEGSVQFPITDESLWARISFRTVSRDGTYNNLCAGLPDRALRADRATFCGEKPNLQRDRGPDGTQFTGDRSLDFKSKVDAHLPRKMNDRENWALRGVFLFQPDLPGDIDMDWLMAVRGSRLDQYSFVGQSIGTNGNSRFIDPTLVTRRETQNFNLDLQRQIRGLLGSQDGRQYRDPEVAEYETQVVDATVARRRAEALAEGLCVHGNVQGNRDPEGCPDGLNPAATHDARREVAKELGKNLDSKPHTGGIDRAGRTTNDTFGFSLKGTTEFGDTMELTTITGYDKWNRSVDIDLDFTPNIVFENKTDDDGYQVFQEVRLTGQAFDDLDEIWGGPLDWEVGAFLLKEELNVDVVNRFDIIPPGVARTRTYTQDVTTYAGYASAAWDFWDAFTLDGGVRYNYEKRHIDYTLFTIIPNEIDQNLVGKEPTGTVRLTWRPNEQSSLYMKYTHGWKSGTFNASGSRDRGVAPAGPEKIDAFEIGLAGSYFDERLRLMVSLFHYDYSDYQLFTPILESQQPVQFVIKNASDVELYGSEVELTLVPWEGGSFDVKFAWLRGEFLNFLTLERRAKVVGFTRIDIVTPVDYSGNTLLNAPRYSVTLSAQQAIPLGRFGALVMRWDGTWKDITYFDPSEGRGGPNENDDLILPEETIGQGSFWLHNLRLSYYTPDETIEVAGWIRNVEDATYKAFAADITAFTNTTLFFVGQPRTYGVTMSLRF